MCAGASAARQCVSPSVRQSGLGRSLGEPDRRVLGPPSSVDIVSAHVRCGHFHYDWFKPPLASLAQFGDSRESESESLWPSMSRSNVIILDNGTGFSKIG